MISVPINASLNLVPEPSGNVLSKHIREDYDPLKNRCHQLVLMNFPAFPPVQRDLVTHVRSVRRKHHPQPAHRLVTSDESTIIRVPKARMHLISFLCTISLTSLSPPCTGLLKDVALTTVHFEKPQKPRKAAKKPPKAAKAAISMQNQAFCGARGFCGCSRLLWLDKCFQI